MKYEPGKVAVDGKKKKEKESRRGAANHVTSGNETENEWSPLLRRVVFLLLPRTVVDNCRVFCTGFCCCFLL